MPKWLWLIIFAISLILVYRMVGKSAPENKEAVKTSDIKPRKVKRPERVKRRNRDLPTGSPLGGGVKQRQYTPSPSPDRPNTYNDRPGNSPAPEFEPPPPPNQNPFNAEPLEPPQDFVEPEGQGPPPIEEDIPPPDFEPPPSFDGNVPIEGDGYVDPEDGQ